MRGLTFHGPHDVRVDDLPEPTIMDPTDALVRVTMAGICGSDLHVYHAGDALGITPGTRLGHEFIGTVEAVGGEVRSVAPGDRVLAAVHACDGVCAYCREGKSYACTSLSIFGWGPHVWRAGGDVQGGQSELVRVPLADGTLVRMPEVLSDPEHEATLLPLVDVMSTGWHGLTGCRIEAGQAVVVIGDGAVGLSAVHGARALDAGPIVCLGHHEDRLALARRLGATHTATSRNPEEIREIVAEATGGQGAHGVVDTISSTESMEAAYAAVRSGGTIASMGMDHFMGKRPEVNWYHQFTRNITITGGYIPGPAYLGRLLSLVEAGRMDPSPLITHRLPVAAAPEGYRLMADRAEGVVKVALTPA